MRKHLFEPKKQLQDRAVSVIKPLIPPDAEERVKHAFRQFNQTVREHIRNETALRLADEKGQVSLPVRIKDGFPTPLAELIDQYRDPVLWRLILAQPRLGAIIDGLNFLLVDWDAFERWPHLPEVARGGRAPMERTREIASALQRVVLAKEVREKIKLIIEDILGIYNFADDRAPYIELYWMAIALVAAMQDLKIEDLTVVVLAHELTHGYSHIGRDIDGQQWSTNAFAKCEAHITEGLAQFYTQVVTEKLAPRSPGPKHAYEEFLKLQSGPYRAHETWIDDETTRRGETVRFAMIAARTRGPLKHDEWTELLEQTRESLRHKR
jgi:hypothetical protein